MVMVREGGLVWQGCVGNAMKGGGGLGWGCANEWGPVCGVSLGGNPVFVQDESVATTGLSMQPSVEQEVIGETRAWRILLPRPPA